MLTISSVAVSNAPPQAPVVKAQPSPPAKAGAGVSPQNAGVSVEVSEAGAGRVEAVYVPQPFAPVSPASQAPEARLSSNPAAPERVAEVAASAVAAVAVGQALRAREAGADVTEAPSVQEAAQVQAQEKRGGAKRTVAADELASSEGAESARQSRASVPRFKGEFPVEYKAPDQLAQESQINDLLQNTWKASRAAVDVLIGEEARAAAAARAASFAPPPDVPSERGVEAAETYQRTGSEAELPSPGSQFDRRV